MTRMKDVMVKNVITITKDKSIVDAAVLMKDKNISALVVVENDYPIGIITERDLCQKVIAQKKSVETAIIKDVMSKTIITAEEDDDFDEINKKMIAKKIKKIPIVRNKKIVGIFTDSDLQRYIYRLGNTIID
jgi:CBS domain-containing protein